MHAADLPELDCLELITTRFHFHKIEKTSGHDKMAGIYGLSIQNSCDMPVRIIGRKWITLSADGDIDVVEGDCLFGSRPLLMPGQIFAFQGFHIVKPPASISLTLIGRDNNGDIFRTPTYSLHTGLPACE